LNAPERSCRRTRNATARTKSRSWIQDMYCAPPASGPPRPKRARRRRRSNGPPRPAPITIAVRSSTLRVAGVSASVWARSHALADPWTNRPAIPGDLAKGTGRLRTAGQDDHLVPLLREESSEQAAELAASSGDDDPHAATLQACARCSCPLF